MSVGIIIPTKSKLDFLFRCIDSIKNKTKQTKYHIYIADTGSSEQEVNEIISYIKKEFSDTKNVTLIKYDFYNFSKINNHVVVKHAKEDFILCCNNDIELIDNCIDAMYSELVKHKDTGTVGCRLLFKDGTVQHAGQVAFTHRPEGWLHPDDKLEVTHRGLKTNKKFKSREQVMGNTAALMMVRREVYGQAEGFNEKYNECFEDVEFNMRVMMNGYKNIYLDSVSAVHYESTTRTKSVLAMRKLESDYINNLFPFWCTLSKQVQKSLSSFALT